MKFILYFSEFCTIYYEFLKFRQIFQNIYIKNEILQINKCMNSIGPLFGPWRGAANLAQQPKQPDSPSRSAHGVPAQCVVTALGNGTVARLSALGTMTS
jgi:hypothetical protein